MINPAGSLSSTRLLPLGALLLATVIFPGLASAHQGGTAGGFSSGLWHPVLGFDHFLAMVSVGILSAQIGGRAVWTVPLTFVSVMAGGAVLGMNGINIVQVEVGIAFSVLALGVAMAAEKKLPAWLAMLSVGVFAVFHGHAHGTEMPAIAQPFVYAAGFIAGTAGIHILGVMVGVVCKRTARMSEFLRFTGAGISGVGIHILYLLQKYAA